MSTDATMPRAGAEPASRESLGRSPTDHVKMLLDTLCAPPLIPAVVERKPDPESPGKTDYFIKGHSRASVQNAISDLMDLVDRHDGWGAGSFNGPFHNCDGWHASGFVVLR